jgi:hypothetical protein
MSWTAMDTVKYIRLHILIKTVKHSLVNVRELCTLQYEVLTSWAKLISHTHGRNVMAIF